MLTSLRIQNFKAWKDTGPIRLAPLTVIFGANSAGKSSLGHLLLVLKQTVLSTDRKRPLHLGDEKSLIELGTFEECVHNHDLAQPLRFGLGWRLPGKREVRDPLSQRTFNGDELKFEVSLLADKKDQPRVQQLAYELLQLGKPTLSVKYGRDENNKLEIHSDEYALVRTTGRPWPLDEPDKFYRISDQSRARFQNAEFLSDFALRMEAQLNSLYYLGPLREYPKRIRLQRRVAEGELMPEDVAVYFCRNAGSATESDPLRLNMFGEIENWPENFFGDEMADIAARTLAATQRKIAQREGGGE